MFADTASRPTAGVVPDDPLVSLCDHFRMLNLVMSAADRPLSASLGCLPGAATDWRNIVAHAVNPRIVPGAAPRSSRR